MSIPPSSLRVAVVGSGPSGFYATDALLKSAPGIQVDLIDRLPTPYGLVRGGVAPDHPKIKSVTRVFEKTAQLPGFRFIGHVQIGQDLSTAELRRCYDAVIYAIGAESDPLAVVDPHCRVYGVAGLRVADASVMPKIVSANTNMPTIMIAERVAEFMRKAH